MLKKTILFFSAVFLLSVFSCNEDDPVELPDSKITAREELSKVLNKARSDFSADAQLSAIYGRNVSRSGEIDLLNTNSLNAFFYIVQSDVRQQNEFYIPVYQSEPVKSPLNFNQILSLVKNPAARDVVGTALNALSGIHIDPGFNFNDSPAAVNTGLTHGGNEFLDQNSGAGIDMLLLPSKSLDSLSVENSADWIINFYGDTESLVLWIHSGTGMVTVLSD